MQFTARQHSSGVISRGRPAFLRRTAATSRGGVVDTRLAVYQVLARYT